MFERIKRFFGKKSTPTVAWERSDNTSTPASGRSPIPPPPQLASSRTHEPVAATRSRSAAVMGAPSAESVMAAKRQQTASSAAKSPTPAQLPMATQRQQASVIVPPPAADNRRVVKSFQRGERTEAKDFLDIASGGGQRHLGLARSREVQFKTRHGVEEGISLLHRTGSVTELHLNKNEPSVMAAKHHSKTTGQTFEVRARDMRGPAKRQLDRVARRHDKR